MMASSATSQNWEKKPLSSCLLHVLVTSKAAIGALFSFFKNLWGYLVGWWSSTRWICQICLTCLTMSERKVEKFRNHAIFWLHVTAYCLNMATLIWFCRRWANFNQRKAFALCCNGIFLLSLGCKISPKIWKLSRVYGISVMVQSPMIWVWNWVIGLIPLDQPFFGCKTWHCCEILDIFCCKFNANF